MISTYNPHIYISYVWIIITSILVYITICIIYIAQTIYIYRYIHTYTHISIDKHNSHTNNIEEEEIYNTKKGTYIH